MSGINLHSQLPRQPKRKTAKRRRNTKGRGKGKQRNENTETLPEPKGTPEDRGQAGLNNVGTGKTRDVTMWERPDYERTALERLRDLNNQEW